MKKINKTNDALAMLKPRDQTTSPKPKAAIAETMGDPEPGKADTPDVTTPPSLLPLEEGAGAPPAEIESSLHDETEENRGPASRQKKPRKRKNDKRNQSREIIPLEVAPELQVAVKMAALEREKSVSSLVEMGLLKVRGKTEKQPPEKVNKYLNKLYPITRIQGKRTSLMLSPDLLRDVKRIAVRTGIPLKYFINAAFSLAI